MRYLSDLDTSLGRHTSKDVVLSLVNSRDYIDTLNAYIATPPREVGGVYFRGGGGGGGG